MLKRYLYNLVCAISVLLNALTGGSYHSTLSARVGYESIVNEHPFAKLAHLLINHLFFWEVDHCRSAYHNEQDAFIIKDNAYDRN